MLKDSEARGILVRLCRQYEFSGPLPPASELEAYERVVPGSAARIVTWAEEEGKHRRSVEQIVVSTGAKNSSRGAAFAFSLAVLVIAAGTAIILTGHSPYGLAMIIVALVSLLGVFVVGRVSASRQLAKTDQGDD